ncbi:MAG TPA: SpoIIE family protein phosphatase [Frankiaceae bacterium]|nr:SpoIIE family protein phosphatase [Frankiaceae bacterium]
MNREAAAEQFIAALLDDDADELYERAPCGYLSTTPDGVIVKVNQTFLTMSGYTRDDLLGRYFTDLLTAGGKIYHETHYAPMLRMQGKAREIALDVVRADRQRIPVLVNAAVGYDESGEPRVIRTAVFDATERREYERELLRAKQRAEESEARARTLAKTLQQTLIPPTPPSVPGLDVATVYRAAGGGDEVGGDFYDVFQTDHRDWVVVIGDVSGKGVDAAVVTALARYTLRAAALRSPHPADALAMLNEVMIDHETDRYCTVAMLRLREGDGWTASVSAGGHPLPYLLRPGDAPREVGAPGSLIGLLPEARFGDVDVALLPGDALVLYTDGVTEARAGEEFYGAERLEAAILRYAGTAASLAHGVADEALTFQLGVPRDDIAVVVLRVPG